MKKPHKSGASRADREKDTVRHSVLWRRLHEPGHDACRLLQDRHGWRLEGTAVFLQDGAPACLSYRLTGTPDWLSSDGRVTGFVGNVDIDVTIERDSARRWLINGAPVAGLDDCEHLDFGFTPATNLPHLRWLDASGQASASVPVAWLRAPYVTLERLPQQYTRLTETRYRYEAPSEGFTTELSVAPSGFVRRYLGLWEVEE